MKRLVLFATLVCLSCSNEPKNTNTSDYNTKIESRLSTVRTPTVLLTLEEWPKIHDDLDLEAMELAIDRQLVKFARLKKGPNIRLGHITYNFSVFKRSLEDFAKLNRETRLCLMNTKHRAACYDAMAASLKQRFHLFAPLENGQIPQTFFTAYHTPVLQASLKKTSDYKAGIHLKPQEGNLRSLTRNQINFANRLQGSPYEVMYINDYFDQYLLHIQGGGKVVYKDVNGLTKSKYLNYDGHNGQPFRFISKYMQQQGYIQDLSNESQRDFLDKNPHKQKEIYNYSPSYVFFKLSEEPPHGNDAVSLTDNRSIATDYRIYKLKGLLTFVKTKRPLEEGGEIDFSRFLIDHDTGGAIRGPARADLYFGEDDYAAFVASNLKVRGEMYFLALRPEFL